MRNTIVHEYVRLDLDRIPAAVPLAVAIHRGFVTAVAKHLVDPP